MERPKRRFDLQITIGGDTWEDVARACDEIVSHVAEHGPACTSVSGGPSSGWAVSVTERPEMTHEAYFAAVEKYLAEQREGGGA